MACSPSSSCCTLGVFFFFFFLVFFGLCLLEGKWPLVRTVCSSRIPEGQSVSSKNNSSSSLTVSLSWNINLLILVHRVLSSQDQGSFPLPRLPPFVIFRRCTIMTVAIVVGVGCYYFFSPLLLLCNGCHSVAAALLEYTKEASTQASRSRR